MIGKSFENKNAESIGSMGLAQVSGVNLISEVDHISRLTLNSSHPRRLRQPLKKWVLHEFHGRKNQRFLSEKILQGNLPKLRMSLLISHSKKELSYSSHSF